MEQEAIRFLDRVFDTPKREVIEFLRREYVDPPVGEPSPESVPDQMGGGSSAAQVEEFPQGGPLKALQDRFIEEVIRSAVIVLGRGLKLGSSVPKPPSAMEQFLQIVLRGDPLQAEPQPGATDEFQPGALVVHPGLGLGQVARIHKEIGPSGPGVPTKVVAVRFMGSPEKDHLVSVYYREGQKLIPTLELIATAEEVSHMESPPTRDPPPAKIPGTPGGTHLGTPSTYDPDVRPFVIDGKAADFDEAHRALVRELLPKPETIIFKVEASGSLAQLKPSAPSETAQAAEAKLRLLLPKLALPGDIPVHFCLFSGAAKPPSFGTSPFALLDHEGAAVYLEAGAGGVDPATREPRKQPSVYLTQELFQILTPETLEWVLREELTHATAKAKGHRERERWEDDPEHPRKVARLQSEVLARTQPLGEAYRHILEAQALMEMGMDKPAEEILRDLLDPDRVSLPGQLLDITSLLDGLLERQGRHEDRVAAARRAVEVAGRVFNPGSPKYANPMNRAIPLANARLHEAYALEDAGRIPEALKAAEQALAALRRDTPPPATDHHYKEQRYSLLARLGMALGDLLLRQWEADLDEDALRGSARYLADAKGDMAQVSGFSIEAASMVQARLGHAHYYLSRLEPPRATHWLVEARKQRETALALYRGSDALYLSGVLALAAGDDARAERDLIEALGPSAQPTRAIKSPIAERLARLSLRRNDPASAERWLDSIQEQAVSLDYDRGLLSIQQADALWPDAAMRPRACELYQTGISRLDRLLESPRGLAWLTLSGEFARFYEARFKAHMRAGERATAMALLPALVKSAASVDDVVEQVTSLAKEPADYEALVDAAAGLKPEEGARLMEALVARLQRAGEEGGAAEIITILNRYGEKQAAHALAEARRAWDGLLSKLLRLTDKAAAQKELDKFLKSTGITLPPEARALVWRDLALSVTTHQAFAKKPPLVHRVVQEAHGFPLERLSEPTLTRLSESVNELERNRAWLNPLSNVRTGLLTDLLALRDDIRRAIDQCRQKAALAVAARQAAEAGRAARLVELNNVWSKLIEEFDALNEASDEAKFNALRRRAEQLTADSEPFLGELRDDMAAARSHLEAAERRILEALEAATKPSDPTPDSALEAPAAAASTGDVTPERLSVQGIAIEFRGPVSDEERQAVIQWVQGNAPRLTGIKMVVFNAAKRRMDRNTFRVDVENTTLTIVPAAAVEIGRYGRELTERAGNLDRQGRLPGFLGTEAASLWYGLTDWPQLALLGTGIGVLMGALMWSSAPTILVPIAVTAVGAAWGLGGTNAAGAKRRCICSGGLDTGPPPSCARRWAGSG